LCKCLFDYFTCKLELLVEMHHTIKVYPDS
jgi:hypothetical protein